MSLIKAILLAVSISAFGPRLQPTGAAEVSDAMPSASSRFARLENHRIHYVNIGRGPTTVVLVHGWGGDLRAWRFQAPALQEHSRVLMVDLPGHGRSDKPQTPYTMEFFARAIDAVLRDANVEQAVLAGFSMGTPVICRFYRDFPNKVLALVAADGSLHGFDMSREKFDQFAGRFRGENYRAAVSNFISAMFPNPGTESLRDATLKQILQTPQHVLAGAMEGMFDKAAWEPERIAVPLLVLNARNPMWTAEYETLVRKLQPKAEYRLIEGTGHFHLLEKPSEFNAHLIGFLRQQGFITASSPAKAGESARGTEAAQMADWKPLFDGRTLRGWRLYGKKAPPAEGWKVEDGILKKMAKVRGGDIITEEKFKDFELSWAWRLLPGGNNGLKYLVTEDRPGAPGHEYQMIDDEGHPDAGQGAKRMTASFYDVLPPSADRPTRPAGEWNESRVIVRGNRVEHWLNGARVLEYELGSEATKAAVANSKFKTAAAFGTKIEGHIMLTDHQDECWFRDIKLRELPVE